MSWLLLKRNCKYSSMKGELTVEKIKIVEYEETYHDDFKSLRYEMLQATKVCGIFILREIRRIYLGDYYNYHNRYIMV